MGGRVLVSTFKHCKDVRLIIKVNIETFLKRPQYPVYTLILIPLQSSQKKIDYIMISMHYVIYFSYSIQKGYIFVIGAYLGTNALITTHPII